MGNFLFAIIFLLFSFVANAQTAAQKNYQPPLNLLVNGGFESGKAQWVNSGGTFAITTSAGNVLDGKSSGSFDASSTGQYVETALQTIPAGLQGKNCMARIEYKGGDENLVMKVLDGSANLMASRVLPGASTVKQSVPLNFPCPSSGGLKLRIESTANAAVVYIDKAHIGETDNLLDLSQASLVGTLDYSANGNCRWILSSVASFTDFPVDSDCNTPTTTGDIAANDGGKVPGFKILHAKPGTYKIVATGSFRHIVSSGNWPLFRFTDGTNFTTPQGVGINGATAVTVPNIVGSFTYSSAQTNVNIKMQAGVTAGTQDVEVYAESNVGLNFEVYYFPSSEQQAFLPETRNWKVDATITGGANMSLGNVSPASGIESTTFSLANNSVSNSIPAKISCESTEQASGSTCTGNESLGITFDNPVAGEVNACISFTQTITNTSSGIGGEIQLVETPNNAQTVIQYGKIKQFYGNGTAGGHIEYRTHYWCDTLNLSAGTKTLRWFYSQTAAGLSSHTLSSDVHISVEPKSQQIPAPILVKKPKVSGYYNGVPTGTLSAAFTNATYPSILREYPSGMYSSGVVTIPETGLYDISASFSIIASSNPGEYVSIGLFVNGSTQIGGYAARWVVSGGNGSVTTPVNLKAYPLTAGDTIEVKGTTSATGASYGSMLSTSESFFSFIRVDE